MSVEAPETSRWTSLSRAQVQTYVAEIAASGIVVFSEGSHEVGVGMASGLRQPVTLGPDNTEYRIAGWVDRVAHGAVNAIIVSDELINAKDEQAMEQARRQPLAYARVRSMHHGAVTSEDEWGGRRVEGVALNLPTSRGHAHYYGLLELPQASNISGNLEPVAYFLSKALRHAAHTSPDNSLTADRPILGVDHLTSRRVFIGLASLRPNLLIGNQLLEPEYMAGRAYKVAAGLLAVAADEHFKGRFNASIGHRNPTGELDGVLFLAPEGDMVAVRQMATRPETLLVTVAHKPRGDTMADVQQYFIQERGVFTLMGQLPPHDFTLPGLAALLPSFDKGIQHALDSRINLSDCDVDVLVHRMTAIMQSQSSYALRDLR